MIDLHCHSTASDGMLPPAAVVQVAADVGLSAIALTDHDSTAGLDEAREAGEVLGVQVIGGCEFSVAAPWGEMHLLGYFIPTGDPAIEAFLVEARAMRADRTGAMLDRLQGLGIRLDRKEVLREADGGALGRPHVARVLHRGGHVHSIQAAFDKYLGRGRPAYVDKVLPTLREVADLVHRRGGVVSAAHLKSFGTLEQLTALQADGLDAVEVRHPSHNGDRVATITEAALALGLARSGGSDWHGEMDTIGTHATLGSQQVPEAWLADLAACRQPVSE
jgi:predicted metal-dependent phosphoesterase TrpH